AELERLLAHDQAASNSGDTLADRLVPVSRSLAAEPAKAGARIGGYHLLREIGSGGMGSVFLAEREDEEFRYQVAIKLVRGFPTRDVLERFRRERELLATLCHPNIARLFDGGTTAEGQPYLVMEYVEGVPLDQWCREQKPSLRRRLRVFQSLCSAVIHAHQHLIIHRDIKPANVLVRPDGEPVLLDFGIGKLVEAGSGTPDEGSTRMQALTPAYASPEQLKGRPASTLSDVFGLGLLLYELLCCKPLRDSAGRITQLSASRVMAEGDDWLRSQARQTRGDLDNIVRKCLQEDSSRRYSGVGALAADIQAWFDGRPVQAAPDAWHYRLRKFVTRHPIAVGASAAAVLVLALLAGQLVTENRRALAAEEQSRLDAEVANQSATFLVDLFRQASPEAAQGKEITLRVLIDSARDELVDRDFSRPAIKARLERLLGEIYHSLGLVGDSVQMHEAAVERLRNEIGSDAERELARSRHQLSRAYENAGRHEEAITLAAQSLAWWQAQPTVETEPVVRLYNTLGVPRVSMSQFDQAMADFRAAEAILRAEPVAQPDLLSLTLHNQGWALQRQGDNAAALPLLEESLALRLSTIGELHPRVLSTKQVLAMTEARLGLYDQAIARLEQVLEGEIKVLGVPSHNVALAHNELGYVFQDAGRYGDARRHFLQALEQHRQMTPDGSSQMAVVMNNLATVIDHHEDFVAAEAMFREGLAMRIASGMPERAIARAQFNLIRPLLALGQLDEAERLAEQALAVNVRQHASAWSEQVGTVLGQARIALARDDVDKAREHLDAARALHERATDFAYFHAVASDVELAEGRIDQARSSLETTLSLMERQFPPNHPRLLSVQLRLLSLARPEQIGQIGAALHDMEERVRAHFHPHGPTWTLFEQLREQHRQP
ncbi:MAG: tetratricopeptide repeat protein, partial [Lysobacterales bacterium]